MKSKLWIFAFLISLASTMIINSLKFDPYKFIEDSKLAFNKYENYSITYDLVMDVSMLGVELSYFNVYTLTRLGREVAYVSSYSTPFSITPNDINFYLGKAGNFSCSKIYNVSACYPMDNMDLSSYEVMNLINQVNIKEIEYLGNKAVNNDECRLIKIVIDMESIQKLIPAESDQKLKNEVLDYILLICLGESNGVLYNSDAVINAKIYEPGTQATYLVSYNITQTLINFSLDVDESVFNLPYELMSFDEYQILVNETIQQA